MEILLGLSTWLHSLWPNQVVSKLQSSYAAWLDHTSPRRYCSFQLELQTQRCGSQERECARGSAFVSPIASLLNLDPSTCKCIYASVNWTVIMHVRLLFFFLHDFINASMQSKSGKEIIWKELSLSLCIWMSHLFCWAHISFVRGTKGWCAMSRPWKAQIKMCTAPETPLGLSHLTEGYQGSFHAFLL